jgi:hypothetical protein
MLGADQDRLLRLRGRLNSFEVEIVAYGFTNSLAGAKVRLPDDAILPLRAKAEGKAKAHHASTSAP